MSVRDDDHRPAYVQVADDLRRLVKEGRLKPGQRLRSAREMAKEYGVALMTFQRALDLLKDEKVLVGVHGRGTFVQSGGDASEEEPESSSEFTVVMNQIHELRDLMREQMGALDDRVSSLEHALRQNLQAPKRDS